MDNAKRERLIQRICHVTLVTNLETFSAKAMADRLQADKYDVLSALHEMLNRGSVEWLTASDVFSDLWRRKCPFYVKPTPKYQEEKTPICSILEAA